MSGRSLSVKKQKSLQPTWRKRTKFLTFNMNYMQITLCCSLLLLFLVVDKQHSEALPPSTGLRWTTGLIINWLAGLRLCFLSVNETLVNQTFSLCSVSSISLFSFIFWCLPFHIAGLFFCVAFFWI